MKIVVLAKQVPDTWSDRKIDLETGMLDRQASDPVPDEINERALETALQYKEANSGVEIVVVSMGPEGVTDSIRKLLSMGADSAIVVTDPSLAGSDIGQTARVLAAAIEKVDPQLVLAGNEATDGRGGMVPAMVAQLLDWPVMPGLDDVELTAHEVSGSAGVDGARLSLSAELPAVVSVTEKSAEPRFPNFRGIMQAKKKPMETWSLSELGLDAGPESAAVRSVMVAADARPPKQAGPKVVDDGTGASQLADFLVTNRLV